SFIFLPVLFISINQDFVSIKAKQAKLLFTRLRIGPVRSSIWIINVHRIPSSLKPFILPSKDEASHIICINNIFKQVRDNISLLGFTYKALIPPMNVVVGFTSGAWYSKFGNQYRNIMCLD